MQNTENPASSSDKKTVHIMKNETIDIYFNEDTESVAKKHIKHFEKMGYELQQTSDNTEEYKFCSQMIRTKIIK